MRSAPTAPRRSLHLPQLERSLPCAAAKTQHLKVKKKKKKRVTLLVAEGTEVQTSLCSLDRSSTELYPRPSRQGALWHHPHGIVFPLRSPTLAQFQRASRGNRPSLQPTRGLCHLTPRDVLLRGKASPSLLPWRPYPTRTAALGFLRPPPLPASFHSECLRQVALLAGGP